MNKNLKKILTLLVAVLATTAFAACGDDDDKGAGGGTPVSALTVRPLALSFPAEGGIQTINAQAPVQASATSSTTWCQLVVGSQTGDLKTTPIEVVVEPNTTTYSRTAVITVTAGSQTATVTVTQDEGSVAPSGTITKDATTIAKEMYPGWNLGNTLEATGDGLAAETAWQPTKTTQQVIDAVKAAGFRSVRIPCSWNIHSDGSGVIDAAWMARVKQVVDYCINDGLYVVLNDHWDGGWIEVEGFSTSTTTFKPLSDAQVAEKANRLADLWTQIATAFRDYDEHLLFAGLNEPFQQYDLFSTHHAELTPTLAIYNAAFVGAVRATGGNNALRTLVVQGPSTDITSTCNYLHLGLMPEAAGRLMLEVHYYNPGQFCGTFDATGAKAFYYWGAGNHSTDHNANYGEESDMRNLFKMLNDHFTSKGYPVIIGEYAAQQRTISGDQDKHNASVKAFYQCVNQYGLENGIVPFAWDTNDVANLKTEGGSSTIIDRSGLKVVGEHALAGIMAAIP